MGCSMQAEDSVTITAYKGFHLKTYCNKNTPCQRLRFTFSSFRQVLFIATFRATGALCCNVSGDMFSLLQHVANCKCGLFFSISSSASSRLLHSTGRINYFFAANEYQKHSNVPSLDDSLLLVVLVSRGNRYIWRSWVVPILIMTDKPYLKTSVGFRQ